MLVRIIALCLFASPAAATTCMPRDTLVAVLAGQYAETPRIIGLAMGNQVMEVFASDAGSWTAVMTNGTGMSCIMTTGQNFESLTPAAIIPGIDG